MRTIADRIVEYLSQHAEGATDGELRTELGLKHYSQANDRCRKLARQGLIRRERVNGVLRNFSVTGGRARPVRRPHHEHEPWHWEGNIQAAVVRHLVEQGCAITRVADTRTRERGKDIEATLGSGVLWVTVKGYPIGTPKTQPATQATHWFSQALFDVICWRGEDPNAELALAVPDFPRYRNLAERVSWLKSAAHFYFIWVEEDGAVQVER